MWIRLPAKYVMAGQVFRLPYSGGLYLCLERSYESEEDGSIIHSKLGWELVPVAEQPECRVPGCRHVHIGLLSTTEYHQAAPQFEGMAAMFGDPTYFYLNNNLYGKLGVDVYAPSPRELTDEQWRAASLYQAVAAIDAKPVRRASGPGLSSVPGQFRLRWLLLSLWQRLLRLTLPLRSRLGLISANERKQIIEERVSSWIEGGMSPETARRLFGK